MGTENSSNGCDCSSTSIWGVLEVLALIVVAILFIYIAYNCVMSYCTRKKRSKEIERRRFVEHMENKFRTPPDQRAIQMGPTAPSECNRAHIHVPERYQNPPQNTGMNGINLNYIFNVFDILFTSMNGKLSIRKIIVN